MSRIVRFHELGGPEVLRIEEIETPVPAPGEVRIDVKAIGLNRAEELFRTGRYAPPIFPSRIGYEAAGTIRDVGAGVTGFAPGDVVSVVPVNGGVGRYGTYGEIATVPAASVVKHPPLLSFEEAAAAWMQYVTAYGGLIDVAALKAGDIVAITAASSSVGLAAIQIANLVGAMPIAITRTAAKRDALLRAGAAHVVISSEQDVGKALGEITNGAGARIVFDPVAGPSAVALIEATASHGIYVLYGFLDDRPITFSPSLFLIKALTFATFRIGDLTTDPERKARALAFVLEGLKTGALRPIIAEMFPLDRIVDAHRYLESNEQFGKIVVTV